MVEVGIVSSVNVEIGAARVAFPGRETIVSPELPVMKSVWPVKPGDVVVCIYTATGRTADGFIFGSFYSKDDPPGGG